MKIPLKLMRYLPVATRFVREGRLPELLRAVSGKELPQSSRFGQFQKDVSLCKDLCAAWFSGCYRAVNKSTLLSVVAALVYFVTPLDVVPDWILGAGFLDDLAVLAWVLKKFHDELESFRLWRDGQSAQVVALLAQVEQAPNLGEQP